jgi:hypothetical protein
MDMMWTGNGESPMASEQEARHPIGVVSTRTGIPQDVLRAWERRYSAVTPQRTETGRRLYSDLDLLRFRLLKAAVDSGRRQERAPVCCCAKHSMPSRIWTPTGCGPR